MKTKATGNNKAVRFCLGLNVAIIIWLAYSSFWSGTIVRTRSLILTDRNGGTRMMLSALTEESGIMLNGGDGTTSLSFWVTKLGYPTITMRGPNHKPAVEISTVSQGGGAQVSLFDTEGNRVWQVMVDDSGQPRILETPRVPTDTDESDEAAENDDSGDTGG